DPRGPGGHRARRQSDGSRHRFHAPAQPHPEMAGGRARPRIRRTGRPLHAGRLVGGDSSEAGGRRGLDMDAKPPAAISGTGAPLTEAQTGLCDTQRSDPANPILNTGQYLDIAGRLAVEAFRKAVDETVEEAEALSLR